MIVRIRVSILVVQRIVGWYSSLTSLREGREDSIAKETPLEISMFEFLRTQGMQLNDDERASLSSSSFVAEIHPCPCDLFLNIYRT